MGILLSDTEMEIAHGVVELPHDMSYTNTKDICRAQLKKVVGWLDEFVWVSDDYTVGLRGSSAKFYEAYQALKKEAGL